MPLRTKGVGGGFLGASGTRDNGALESSFPGNDSMGVAQLRVCMAEAY